MLALKEVLRVVRTPPFRTPEEADAFAADVGALPPADLLKLLSTLSERGMAEQGPVHRLRCGAFKAIAEASGNAELFVPLVRAMRGADPHLRVAVLQALPRSNDPANHGELCALLGVDDPDLRAVAAHALKQLGGKTALALLTEQARDPGFPGRMEAMDVLCPKAAQHSIPLLTLVLERGKFAEKIQALKYLGDDKLMARDLPAAAAAITPLLRDAEERVVAQAAMSLSRVSGEDAYLEAVAPLVESSSPTLVRALLEGVRRFPSKRMVDLLTRRMRMGPHPIRLLVLESLEAIGTPDVLAPVLDALSHPNIHVRMRASQVITNLGAAGKIEIAQCVLWLLRSPDVNLRRVAVELARNAGKAGVELMPRLLKLLRDEDFWVRERVMDALVEISGPAITRHIVEYLSDPSDVVRRYAIRALVKIADPRALGALVRVAQNDGDWWVREQAVEGIAALKDERAVPYLVDLLQKQRDLRLVCVDALRELKSAAASPFVAPLVTDDEGDLRLAVCRYLRDLELKKELPAIKVLLDDPDPRVKLLAEDTLSLWEVAEAARTTTEKGLSILDRMLVGMMRAGADDLLLAGGRAPFIKREGKVEPLSQTTFSEAEIRAILLPCLTPTQKAELERLRDVDFSHEVRAHKLRFRANVFTQGTGLAAVFRTVRTDIPQLEKLGLPPVVAGFANLKNGLVLLGGPTGSGKSTTLAALINHINRSDARHIVTIEDPIEVVHQRHQSLVNQREVGVHTKSFVSALRSTLRQDPDVILVGEMRDLPTISFAVTAAETGHLVFGTVHTVSADTSIDRIINTFPPGQQPQVRAMLAESLRAVACQHLLKRRSGSGRALAVEVLLNNDAVGNLIRKAKCFQLPSVIATSRDMGMQSMDGDLLRLVREGVVTEEEAYMKANDKKAFDAQLAEGKAKKEKV